MASRKPIAPPARGRTTRNAMSAPSIPAKKSKNPGPSSSKDASNTILALESRPASVASTSTVVSIATSRADTQSFNSAKDKGKGKETGTNIQVVIRCRGPSSKEIAEGSPVTVDTDRTQGEEVNVRTAESTNSLGAVTAAPTRTYPFDHVFGRDADQPLIYNTVVAPLLQQVLLGFNCTVFAYGQTGTGKTYTMQGDVSPPSSTGMQSAEAGIIPRVLARLFQELEQTQYVDSSVRVSYMELYNEDLRDLLAQDVASSSGGAPAGLRIFDEAAKKGVVVQGLEEVGVRDANEAIRILQRGSDRRQIAATNFNDHSSRSHSIFTVIVHIKKTDSKGEDVINIGKLNLVDLAGSENIGRSGAENKRAKEAGMINQSLLTLGRVINALVDKSSHVPYRESKLTRLLQDSLGGSTKTCIIATISPVESNHEETLSTLDYALRAKAIKNKPELNQRITKNGLLKEYVAEIDKLKADLAATRNKNGIYFDTEKWAETEAKHEATRMEYEELRRKYAMSESQLLTTKQAYDYAEHLNNKQMAQLQEVKVNLEANMLALAKTEEQLNTFKTGLEEETVLRRAHQRNEASLNSIASKIKLVAGQSLEDVGGLFAKLERKTAVFEANSGVVNNHGNVLIKEAAELGSLLEEYLRQQNTLTQNIRSQAEQFQTSEVEALSSHSAFVEEQLHKLSESVTLIGAKEHAGSEAANALALALKETTGTIKSGFEVWEKSLKRSCDDVATELNRSWSKHVGNAEKGLQTISELVDTIVQEAQEYVKAERSFLTILHKSTESASDAEIQRLKHQNDLLTRMVDSEKTSSERMRDELVGQMTTLLHNFTNSRDQGLRRTVSEMTDHLVQGQQDAKTRHSAIITPVNDALGRSKHIGGRLEKRKTEVNHAKDMGSQALSEVRVGFRDGLPRIGGVVASSSAAQLADISKHTQSLDVVGVGAFERMDRARRSRAEYTEALQTETEGTYRHIQTSIASSSKAVQDISQSAISDTTLLRNSTQSYRSATSQHLSTLRNSTRLLLDEGTTQDLPTGTTPRKRSWTYDDTWEVTKSRDTVLKEWRANRGTEDPNRAMESLSEHEEDVTPEPTQSAYVDFPVPLNDEDDDVGNTTVMPERSTTPDSIPIPSTDIVPASRPAARNRGSIIAPSATSKLPTTKRTSKRLAPGPSSEAVGKIPLPTQALAETQNVTKKRRKLTGAGR